MEQGLCSDAIFLFKSAWQYLPALVDGFYKSFIGIIYYCITESPRQEGQSKVFSQGPMCTPHQN